MIMRRCSIQDGYTLLCLKMRPDTPQHYEYIVVEDVQGKTGSFININKWRQYFDLKDRKEIPLSFVNHIWMKDCRMECETYFNVAKDESQYFLSDFVFENLKITAEKDGFAPCVVKNMVIKNVEIELKHME